MCCQGFILFYSSTHSTEEPFFYAEGLKGKSAAQKGLTEQAEKTDAIFTDF